MEKFQRSIAKKINVEQVLLGKYIQTEQEADYLLIDEEKIHRLNIIGIIVHKDIIGSMTTFILDDGTGSILLRLFEEDKKLEEINIGNTVITIGKVRMYNEEKYISPEILQKTKQEWLQVRTQELSKLYPEEEKYKDKIKNEEKENKNDEERKKSEKEQKESISERTILPAQKIVQLIKDLDHGEGVLIEEIIEQAPFIDTSKLLEKMLKNGDIFQIVPGKIKVL